LSRLLTHPQLGGTARELTAPEPALDPVVARMVEEAAAGGYRRGVEAGHAEAAAASARTTAAVRAEVDRVVAELRATQLRETGELTRLACAIAEAVLGREPHDGGMTLLARVRDALHDLDDSPLELACHPDDVGFLEGGLADVAGLTLRADPGLAPGEARVTGPWSQAELTRAAAWEAIGEVLA
jgi:flagellar biosynthesis/type III secretory pathway protein FliH